MKINGIKVNFNFELGELDLDIKDIVDVQRLDWEQRRELRKECKECATSRKPSYETKQFVEAVVNKAISSIKDQIISAVKNGGRKNKEVDPDDRIED